MFRSTIGIHVPVPVHHLSPQTLAVAHVYPHHQVHEGLSPALLLLVWSLRVLWPSFRRLRDTGHVKHSTPFPLFEISHLDGSVVFSNGLLTAAKGRVGYTVSSSKCMQHSGRALEVHLDEYRRLFYVLSCMTATISEEAIATPTSKDLQTFRAGTGKRPLPSF